MKRRLLAVLLLILLATQVQGAYALFAFSAHDGADATETVEATPSPSPSPTPEPTQKPIRYGATTKSGVNIRKESNAKASVVRQMPNTGSAFVILDEVAVSGTTWYHVALAGGESGYIRGDLVEEISASEYETRGAQSQTKASSKGASGQKSSSVSGGSTSKQTTKATATEKPRSSGGSVWIPTNGGTKYHRSSGCSGMKGPRNVSTSEAQSLGFTACKKCY